MKMKISRDMCVSQATSVASYLSLGSYAFATSVEAFLAATLAINVSHIAVNELVLAPGATIRPGSQTVNLRVDFTATPSDSFSVAAVSLHQLTRMLVKNAPFV